MLQTCLTSMGCLNPPKSTKAVWKKKEKISFLRKMKDHANFLFPHNEKQGLIISQCSEISDIHFI